MTGLQALARSLSALVRAADRASSQTRADRVKSRLLALMPVATLVLFASLLMPRRAEPDALPMPIVDAAKLDAALAADDALVREAKGAPLPPELLKLGGAMRDMFELEAAAEPDDARVVDAKAAIDDAVRVAITAHGDGPIRALRAVQTARFLEAVREFDATGRETADLRGLGGGFVRRMRDVMWIKGHHVVPDATFLHVAYKLIWNHRVGVDNLPAFQPSLDEMRVLYSFYLTHPHVPDAQVAAFEDQRAKATTPEACALVREREVSATHQWKVERVKRLAAIDPTYPADFALGVTYYQARNYGLAVHAFRESLRKAPEGPYAMRAQNHLKAALAAEAQ
ncbi:MAG: hypothetical protein JNL38_12230 [Myxococcales bacterium]|nr:hypothetical protein [Myxococcales bacterium]